MNSDVKTIIKVGMGATAAAGGLLGITGGDTVVLAGAWGSMMLGIAGAHNVSLDKSTCVKTCAGVIASLAGYKLGCTLLTHGVGALLAVFTLGTSLVIAGGVNAVINALITYRLGCLFDKMYGEQGIQTAALTLGAEALKALLQVPSRREFSEFWKLYK
ncbi:MAG: hypothetical protein Q4D38_12665 [Planctomycetia bacterium]|nr:hypothetical protein [Planctomycetia bacterium]